MGHKLDSQLHEVLDKLNEVQKQQVLEYAANFLEDAPEFDKWNDKSFVAEMESRYNYYKSGGKMVSAEEVDMQVKELFRNAKNK